MEKKQYSFTTEDGREIMVYQEQLRLKQELAIVQLLTDLEIQKPEDLLQASIKDLIDVLIKNEKIFDLFGIVLKGNYKKEDLGDMFYDMQEEIVQDFFSFNRKLTGKLKSLFAEIGSALMSQVQAPRRSQPSDSSTASPAETSPKKKKSAS